MSLLQKIRRYQLTPSNCLSYLNLLCLQWGSCWGTLCLYVKAKLFGVQMGRGVRAHGKVGVLRWPGSSISIGHGVSIISSWRRATARTLTAPTRLRTFGPQARIALGDGCELSGTSISVRSTSVTLGKKVLVGPNCVITDADFHAAWPPEERADNPGLESDRAVSIGDYVWIGMDCIILKGVSIGSGALIGAGSVVTHDIPENCLAAGNPARVIRQLGNNRHLHPLP